MFVSVMHQIQDSQAFLAGGKAAIQAAPGNIKALQFLPSADLKQAVCLWEADSLESLRSHLEPKIGPSSRNTYFAIDAQAAMGLPARV